MQQLIDYFTRQDLSALSVSLSDKASVEFLNGFSEVFLGGSILIGSKEHTDLPVLIGNFIFLGEQ